MIKKIIFILIYIIIFHPLAFANVQKVQVNYDDETYLPTNTNFSTLLKSANSDMTLYSNAKTIPEKKLYLEKAMRKYYIATKLNSSNIDANIGLARTYDIMQLDRLAKEYFYKAGNIDPYNPNFNYYFANFFYTRNDFLNAHKYYTKAYEYGLKRNYDLNYKLGMLYEKLADLETAKYHYINASQLGANSNFLEEKIRLLDELNYTDSQYYLFKKNK